MIVWGDTTYESATRIMKILYVGMIERALLVFGMIMVKCDEAIITQYSLS